MKLPKTIFRRHIIGNSMDWLAAWPRPRVALLVLVLIAGPVMASPVQVKGDIPGPWLILPEDIEPGPNSSFTESITDVNGVVFFGASTLDLSDLFFNQKLWMSNGTPDGTVILDTNPNTLITAGDPANLINVNGTLFFSANGRDSVSDPNRLFGTELWRSDGSLEGTLMVSDIVPGFAASSSPTNLVNVNGKVFFAAQLGGKNSLGNLIGRELWVSDGIPGGATVMVKEINPTGSAGTAGHGIGKIATPIDVNGTLFLWADDGVNGFEPWKSDGTADGTVMVKDINPNPGASSTSFDPNPTVIIGSRVHRSFNPITMGGILYFSADDGTNGVELWKSDGTEGGTVMVANINIAAGAGSDPGWLTAMNGKLFFTADDGVAANGRELWKYDPQTGIAQIVRDIRPGGASSRDRVFGDDMLATLNGTLFFAANDGVNGRALWRSDGTNAETKMFVDLNPATDGSAAIQKLTVVGGALFFAANDGADSVELWGTDGTVANVFKTDVNPGPSGSITLITGPRPIDLVASGGNLFVPADGGTFGDELWNTAATIPTGFDATRTRPLVSSLPPPPIGADLEITITDFFDPGLSEGFLLYSYDIRNNGPGLAVNVIVEEGWDASLTLVGTSVQFCGPAILFTCSVGNIPPGATKSLWTLLRLPAVTAAVFIEGIAVVSSTTPDPVPGNNNAVEETTIQPPSPVAGADLAIAKFDLLDPVLPGTDINYLIQIINNGPSLASNVAVTDTLPPDVSFKSATSSPIGTCTELAGTVTCDIVSLANGASIQIELVVTASTTPSTVTNAASVTSSAFDPDMSNNSTAEDTLVGAPRDAVINEVLYHGTQADDWVELKNIGPFSADLSGWQLCAISDCRALANLALLDGDDLMLQSGEIIRLGAGMDLASVSDLALFETSFFDNPAALVDFLQWDTTADVGRAAMAAGKDIWQQLGPGEFDSVPMAASGESASWCGVNGGGGLLTLSSDFANGAPTPGRENRLVCPGQLMFANGFE